MSLTSELSLPACRLPKEAEILTAVGYVPVGALVDTRVDIHLGDEAEEIEILVLPDQEPMIRVWFEDGGFIDCPADQPIKIKDGSYLPAAGLRQGQKLHAELHPYVSLPTDADVTKDIAYASGWATFAGFEDNNRVAVLTQLERGDALLKRLLSPSVDSSLDGENFLIRYEPRVLKAGYTPLRWRVTSRLAWLAGVMDAVADWVDVDGVWWLSLGSTNEQLIREMRRMALETSYLRPRIRLTDTMNAFMLSAEDVSFLISQDYIVGHEAKPLATEAETVEAEARVADIHALPWKSEVYGVYPQGDFHTVVVNGVWVGV